MKIADRYEVIAFHLQGGMQEVYRCTDHSMNRIVALKTPKQGIVDKRFNRGAQMGARVNHPNVAATLDYVEEQGLWCLVEEFVEGADLGRQLSSDFHYLDPSLTAWVIHNIAKGLRAAHKVGICHRDLKPSNIMTSADPNLSVVKLTDFGIAKLAQSEIEVEIERFGQDENTLIDSNTLLGAIPYLAPECWIDWKSSGQAADIWALGAITCHLLLGKPPFGAGQPAIMKMAQVAQSKQVDLAKPSWFGKHTNTSALEEELWKIVVDCLQVNPINRPTADDLASRFEGLCYSANDRKRGIITSYPITYHNGGKSNSGFLQTEVEFNRWFFHASEFYGPIGPNVGQRVNVSSFPGTPFPRCAPVLLLKKI